jgi:hypothetical protein
MSAKGRRVPPWRLFGFSFQRFSFVRHLAPTAGQIEVR